MQIADLVLELRAELEQLLAGFDTFQDVVKRMGGAVYDLQARFDETTGGYKYFTDAANEATNAVRAQEQSVKSLSDRIGEYVQSQQLQIRALGLVNAASALSLRTAESNRVSMQGLRAAVDSTGASWEIAEGALTGYLDNLERTTAFQRKEGMESLRVLIAATGNYERALKLMPAVLGLAARSSMGLVSAARGVAQAAQGNVFMLGMWIPSLRNATTLQTQFKTKAELATFALKEAAKVKPPPPTPWQQLTQTIEELRRTVGEGLLPVWDTMNSSLVEVGRLGRWAADTGVGRLLLQLGFLALSFLSLRVAVAGILRLLIVFANQMGITAAATALYSAVTGGAALAGAGLTASLGAILAVILLVVAAYEALVQGIAWATYGMERLTGVNKKQAEADRDYILQTASLTERALRAKSKIAGATAEAQSAEEGLTEAANAQSDSMAELIQKHSRLTKMQETVASLTNYRTELTKSEAAAVQELADAHEQYSFAVDVAKMSKGILASQAQLEITNTLKDAELRLAAAEEKLATTRALLAESGLELAKQNDDYLKQAFERQRFNETGIVQASELEQAAADLFTSEQNLYRARKLTGETTKSGIRVAALQAGWDAKTVQGREKMAEIEQRDMYLQGMHTSLVDEYTQVVQDASKKLTHYTDVQVKFGAGSVQAAAAGEAWVASEEKRVEIARQAVYVVKAQTTAVDDLTQAIWRVEDASRNYTAVSKAMGAGSPEATANALKLAASLKDELEVRIKLGGFLATALPTLTEYQQKVSDLRAAEADYATILRQLPADSEIARAAQLKLMQTQSAMAKANAELSDSAMQLNVAVARIEQLRGFGLRFKDVQPFLDGVDAVNKELAAWGTNLQVGDIRKAIKGLGDQWAALPTDLAPGQVMRAFGLIRESISEMQQETQRLGESGRDIGPTVTDAMQMIFGAMKSISALDVPQTIKQEFADMFQVIGEGWLGMLETMAKTRPELKPLIAVVRAQMAEAQTALPPPDTAAWMGQIEISYTMMETQWQALHERLKGITDESWGAIASAISNQMMTGQEMALSAVEIIGGSFDSLAGELSNSLMGAETDFKAIWKAMAADFLKLFIGKALEGIKSFLMSSVFSLLAQFLPGVGTLLGAVTGGIGTFAKPGAGIAAVTGTIGKQPSVDRPVYEQGKAWANLFVQGVLKGFGDKIQAAGIERMAEMAVAPSGERTGVPLIEVHDATPETWVRWTDRHIEPRIRQRAALRTERT